MPANWEYLQGYGLFLSRRGENEVAGKLLEAGTIQDSSNPLRYLLQASWLLSGGNKEAAFGAIRKAISIKPEYTSDAIALLVLNGVTNDEISQALPPGLEVEMKFAGYLGATGDNRMAERYYRRLIESRGDPGGFNPSYFYSACDFFLKEGALSDALKAMEKAAGLFPEDNGARVIYAELLEKSGKTEMAAVEFRKALNVEPSNRRAAEGLGRIEAKGQPVP